MSSGYAARGARTRHPEPRPQVQDAVRGRGVVWRRPTRTTPREWLATQRLKDERDPWTAPLAATPGLNTIFYACGRLCDSRVVRTLDHIRWIGGGTGAGKTTVARRLAERSGVSVYSTDAAIGVHASALSATSAPLLERFRSMSMDERWVLRDPAEMYRTFPWFQGEGFDLLVDDLESLPTDGIILVEGFRLLPHLVRPLLSRPDHAVWLLPTPQFQQAAFLARAPSEAFWLRTADPQRAMDNLLARDQIFTGEIAADAARCELRTMAIDGQRPVEAVADAIASQLDL